MITLIVSGRGTGPVKPGNLSVFEKVLNPAKHDVSKDKRVNTDLYF